jgi:hypothetical protein
MYEEDSQEFSIRQQRQNLQSLFTTQPFYLIAYIVHETQ